MQGPGSPGWMLGASLPTLPYGKKKFTKSEGVRTGCNLAESFKEAYGSKRASLPSMMMMMLILYRFH
jgi:hypothetical protein